MLEESDTMTFDLMLVTLLFMVVSLNTIQSQPCYWKLSHWHMVYSNIVTCLYVLVMHLCGYAQIRNFTFVQSDTKSFRRCYHVNQQ